MNWFRRIRGAVGIGLVWGVAWTAVGALAGMLVDPIAPIARMWLGPPVGIQPGFVGGLLFSALLGLTAPGRGLAELSLSPVSALGGIAGLILGAAPIAINQPPREFPLWQVAATVVGTLTLLGAVSAAASLALARRVKSRKVPAETAYRNGRA